MTPPGPSRLRTRLSRPRSPLEDPLDDQLGYQLRRASIDMMAALTDRFEALGVRLTEAVILRFIDANPGCNQAEIGRALGVTRTNMVPIVGALVDGGLVRREVADGRTHALHLTQNGVDLHSRITLATLDHEQALFGDLDEAERAIFMKVLRSIRAKTLR